MSMTRDDVMRLSGRELDEAVARDVLGLTWSPVAGPVPYSRDIDAAWQVVEHLATPDEALTITYVKGDWVVAVGGAEVVVSSKNAPEAICRAALLSALKRSEAKNGGGGA